MCVVLTFAFVNKGTPLQKKRSRIIQHRCSGLYFRYSTSPFPLGPLFYEAENTNSFFEKKQIGFDIFSMLDF